jgi:hypothetical protein
MKTDTYTKSLLTLVSLVFLSLAGMTFFSGPASVRAASSSPQQWEYLRYQASYAIGRNGSLDYGDTECYIDSAATKCEPSVGLLARLGSQVGS